jgi:ribosomal-protein-alanine N-acetyltransferase
MLALPNGYSVSDITYSDKTFYVEHLKEKQIFDQTLNIPYPYRPEDADWWINHVASAAAHAGRTVNWAIREPKGKLIGGIGFHGLVPGRDHRAELGYWLAKPWWGKGLMTHAVTAATDFAFRELGLERITAHLFSFNQGSERVLQKSGYIKEGELRRHYLKNGQFHDGKLYARLKADPAPPRAVT